MWIKIDGTSHMINTNYIVEIAAMKSEKYKCSTITVLLNGNPKSFVLAKYELYRTAQSAIDVIFEAIENGEKTLILPEDGDPRLSYSDGIVHGDGGLAGRKTILRTTGKTK